MATDTGDVNSINFYAGYCKDGDLFPPDKNEALKYYKILAEKGYMQAMFIVGEMLLNGDDEVSENKEEAVEYIQMAINEGSADACELYSKMLRSGNGVPVNIELADYYENQANITSCSIF